MGSSPGFRGNPFGSMPRARDSGAPCATSQYRSSGCCRPVSPFHLRFLLFQAFPSAIIMSALSSALGSKSPGRPRPPSHSTHIRRGSPENYRCSSGNVGRSCGRGSVGSPARTHSRELGCLKAIIGASDSGAWRRRYSS